MFNTIVYTALNYVLYSVLGAVHKLCQRPKGGGVKKMLTMADKGGRGGKANADYG